MIFFFFYKIPFFIFSFIIFTMNSGNRFETNNPNIIYFWRTFSKNIEEISERFSETLKNDIIFLEKVGPWVLVLGARSARKFDTTNSWVKVILPRGGTAKSEDWAMRTADSIFRRSWQLRPRFWVCRYIDIRITDPWSQISKIRWFPTV